MVKPRDLVESEIKQRIKSGELKFGEVLNMQEFAKRLNVSISPVLHAFRHLEGVGLLEHLPNGATRVKAYSQEEIISAYAVRAAIESMAARFCAVKATDEEIAILQVRVNKIEEKIAVDEWPRDEDRLFHDGVVTFSHVPLLQHTHRHVFLIHQVAGYSGENATTGTLKSMKGNHNGIMNAIAQRNPDEAEQLMREHITQIRRAYEQRNAASAEYESEAN